MRKLLLAFGAVLGLLVAGVGAVWLFVDVNQFRPSIQAELQKQLHRTVTLGTMSLGLFPLSVRVDDLSVAENPQFATGRPFISAKQVKVRAELLPLLRKEVHVNSLILTQPAIELVKNAAGVWNYDDLTSQPSNPNSQPVSLALLQVEDGSVAASDAGKPGTRSVYEHVNLELADFSPGKVYRLKASAQLPGGKSDALVFEGSGGPSGSKNAPLQGKLSLTDAPLSGLARFAGSTLPIDGQLSGTAELQSSPTGANATVKFDLRDAKAEGKPLGFPIALSGNLKQDAATEVSRFTGNLQAGKVPISLLAEQNARAKTTAAAVRIVDASLAEVLGVARLFGAGDISGTGVVSVDATARSASSGPFAYSGTASLRDAQVSLPGINKPLRVQTSAWRFEQNSAQITQLLAGLASTNVRGSASITNFSAPSIGFDLDADKVNVEELQQATSTPATSGPAKSTRSSSPPLYAKGTLHVGTLLSNGLTLTDLRAQCLLDHQVLTLSPLTAQLFGGSQSGSLKADMRQQPTAVQLNLKLVSVDANQLLSAVSSVKNTLFGNLGASGDLHLSLGAPDLFRTLNGNLNLNLVKGRLAGTSILQELSSIGKFAGLNLGGGNVTNITQMGGDIGIVNGLATTNNLKMVMEGGALSAAGTVNLADETLNLKMTAVLDKAISQQAGGTSIGGYLNTALSNSKGELVIPANVTGTFAKPRFAPDAARLAELKLQNVLPSVTGPGGIQSIVDAFRGKQAPAQNGDKSAPQQTQPDQQKQGVQGIIDLFRKKK